VWRILPDNQVCHSIISSGSLKESVIRDTSLCVCGNTSRKIPHKNTSPEIGLDDGFKDATLFFSTDYLFKPSKAIVIA